MLYSQTQVFQYPANQPKDNLTECEKQMYLYTKMASRLEQNLRLKTLGYSIANFFYVLFGCPLANFGLLPSKQYHSHNVNHCILAICFWPSAGMGGFRSLHLTECPVSFNYNAITPQIAENTLPRLKPSFFQNVEMPTRKTGTA